MPIRLLVMKGSTTKDLMQIPGVQGYAVVDDKSVQIRLPSKHPLASDRERFRRIRRDLAGDGPRLGHTIEIILDDMMMTLFLSGGLMLAVMSSLRVNQALLRMTGRLVLAGMVRERGQ